MIKNKLSFVLASVFLFGGLIQPIQAAEDEDARRAILELRSQLKLANQSRSELSKQVQSLKQQLAQLQGQLEVINNNADSKNRSSDDDYYTTPQVGDPDQQQAYDDALNYFRQGDYAKASSELKGFSEQFSDSPLTPSALFYAGSSDYANRNFKQAITTLESMIQRFPEDDQAGDAYLVIAGSQLELDDIDGSKRTLETVVKKYPDSPAADTASERLKMY